MKTIQITVKVPKLKTKRDAEDFGQSLAEHIMETFNDDGSIESCFYKTIPSGRPSIVAQLNAAMDAMQKDPEFEDVDTLAIMEEAISNAITYHTGKIRTTRGADRR